MTNEQTKELAQTVNTSKEAPVTGCFFCAYLQRYVRFS